MPVCLLIISAEMLDSTRNALRVKTFKLCGSNYTRKIGVLGEIFKVSAV